jgi:pimeloyl-ACP methyl ester carboxylesterase
MSAPAEAAPLPATTRHGRLAAYTEGRGPVVMLIHGVGYGPLTLTGAARAVVDAGGRVIVPHRGGYGASEAAPPAGDLAGQVDDLVEVLDAAGAERAVWAGVSGGATIALAAGILRPDRVAGLVLHEPALGPLAPALHARLLGAAAAVASADDPGEGALALAEALGGTEGWARVGLATRQAIRAAGAAVRREIPLFPGFAPTPGELATLRGIPVVSSVGARSGPDRREAGEVLVRLAGAVRARPPSGHLVQIEAPEALARLALVPARRTATSEEDG